MSTTRIADLPEMGSSSAAPGLSVGNNTYIPMDTHPNPYGLPPPPANGGIGNMPNPVATKPGRGQQAPIQAPDYNPYVDPSQGQHRLPSRDSPMDTMQHTQDEYVQANHIPAPPKRVSFADQDYVQEYETRVRQTRVKPVSGTSRLEQFWTEYQTVILVIVLYFIFQMPTIHNALYKQMWFLPLYKEDGALNVYGLLVKSLVFGVAFFGIMTTIDYLSAGI
jgi:hypothetical protein